MNIRAELSLYPLRTACTGNIISRFVQELCASGLKPETGAMNTVVKGECRAVFAAAGRAFEICGDKTDIVLEFKAANVCRDCKLNNRKK